MRKDDYNADGYLEGVEVVSMDWYAVGSADNPACSSNTALFLMWCLSSTRRISLPTAAHIPAAARDFMERTATTGGRQTTSMC
ncbi:MAG: hypothetical protein IJV22_08415 [Bacteroidales bacterium]|nr:hypothetical protein [Bacteroidales bacterium]